MKTDHQKISEDVDAFLRSGGKIQEVPTKTTEEIIKEGMSNAQRYQTEISEKIQEGNQGGKNRWAYFEISNKGA